MKFKKVLKFNLSPSKWFKCSHKLKESVKWEIRIFCFNTKGEPMQISIFARKWTFTDKISRVSLIWFNFRHPEQVYSTKFFPPQSKIKNYTHLCSRLALIKTRAGVAYHLLTLTWTYVFETLSWIVIRLFCSLLAFGRNCLTPKRLLRRILRIVTLAHLESDFNLGNKKKCNYRLIFICTFQTFALTFASGVVLFRLDCAGFVNAVVGVVFRIAFLDGFAVGFGCCITPGSACKF
jgi:hypothetical protein